jgi:phosphatidylserine/phosphatidylglycerophosphate/cardiolipin synthase-like enzyme
MHSKYVVVDGHTNGAQIWTGSTNFTPDAWALQDNNIITVTSAALASLYETDFDELLANGKVAGTGINDVGSDIVNGVPIEAMFSPGEGTQISSAIASQIQQAISRLGVASMVLTSSVINGALNDSTVTPIGIYDGAEMRMSVAQMQPAKVAQFEAVAQHLVAKDSLAFSETGPHNFMHDKILVADDVVVTGSFNFSQSAQQNAENILILHDASIADAYYGYIEKLVAAYKDGTNPPK